MMALAIIFTCLAGVVIALSSSIAMRLPGPIGDSNMVVFDSRTYGVISVWRNVFRESLTPE